MLKNLLFFVLENPSRFFFSFCATFSFRNALVYVDIDKSIHNHNEKSKGARNERWKKSRWLFLYIANFEAFHWNILLSTNLLFLKSASLLHAQSQHPIFHALRTSYIYYIVVRKLKKEFSLSKLHHLILRYLVKQHEISRKTTDRKTFRLGR